VHNICVDTACLHAYSYICQYLNTCYGGGGGCGLLLAPCQRVPYCPALRPPAEWTFWEASMILVLQRDLLLFTVCLDGDNDRFQPILSFRVPYQSNHLSSRILVFLTVYSYRGPNGEHPKVRHFLLTFVSVYSRDIC
jgi:hypothetical protein